jgi:hypothetical protein
MDVNTAATSGQFVQSAIYELGSIDPVAWNAMERPEFHPIPIPFRSGLVEDGKAALVNVMA